MKLNLDQALVNINETKTRNISHVLYQLSDCFGCSLQELSTSTSANVTRFVIDTKHDLQLELRDNNSTTVCSFSDLSLTEHYEYMIDAESNCTISTIAKEGCFYCPVAILVVGLILLSIFEAFLLSYFKIRQSFYRTKISEISNENGTASSSQPFDSDEIQSIGSAGNLELQLQVSGEGRPRRIDALDAFRGLTIVGMIMVNYGGAGYSFLEHKAWDGITAADFVFPFFIYSMGASIAVATPSQIKRNSSLWLTLFKIMKRSIILFLVGISLNSKALNGQSLMNLRLTGVLQRFSISYLVVASMYAIEFSLDRSIKSCSRFNWLILRKSIGALMESTLATVSLITYAYFTFIFSYDELCPEGYVGPGGDTDQGQYANCTGGAAAWIDRLILGENHIYHDRELKEIFKTQISHDPEGILGYTTSIVMTLVGLQCGRILTMKRTQNTHRAKMLMLFIWMLVMAMSSGLVAFVPINKRLWSITYVAVTSSSAILVTIILYSLIDVFNCPRGILLKSVCAAGKNPIFLYVGHSLVEGMLPWFIPVDKSSHAQLLAQLTWSVVVWLYLAVIMSKKNIYVRI